MMPKRVALMLMVLGSVAASVDRANSQLGDTVDAIEQAKRCDVWPAVSFAKGTRVWIFPYWIGPAKGALLNQDLERAGVGWIPGPGGGQVRKEGKFVARTPMIVGMISYSSDPRTSGTDFILPRGFTIDFYPDDSRSASPIPLTDGSFFAFQRRPIEGSKPGLYGIACVRGESETSLVDAPSPGRGPLPPSSDSGGARAERLGEAASMEPLRPPRSIPETDGPSIGAPFGKGDPNPSSLSGVFSSAEGLRPGKDLPSTPVKPGATPGPPRDLSPGSGAGGPSLNNIISPPAAKAPDISSLLNDGKDAPLAPVKTGAASPGSVCDVDTGDSRPAPKDMKFASLQTVGIRTPDVSATGYDYLVIGDAVPLDKKIDVTNSANKFISYDAVATFRNGTSNTLLVAIAGAEVRTKRPEAAPKTDRTLRILVVSGAAELAVSGLEQIDGPLNASAKDRIGLDIEWQLIEPTGSIKSVGQFTSFGALVKAAASANSSRPDVLEEEHIVRVFEGIEGLLRTRKVDRVFWVKGAYAIPSSIPQRFENFLNSVATSGAVPQMPSGKATRWLQIVSANTPGFSIAYLKEPVNALEAGDVFEEDPGPVTAARHLITASEASVLASKLRTAPTFPTGAPKPAGDAAANRNALAGKLVLDAKELFAERGYVLSAESASTLRKLLEEVEGLWDASGVLNQDMLADFAMRSGRPQPTLADIVQMGDSKDYPRLPKTLPDWTRRPLKGLSPDETNKAKTLVGRYAERVNALVEKSRAVGAVPNCGLYYVSEASLGLRSD